MRLLKNIIQPLRKIGGQNQITLCFHDIFVCKLLLFFLAGNLKLKNKENLAVKSPITTFPTFLFVSCCHFWREFLSNEREPRKDQAASLGRKAACKKKLHLAKKEEATT